MVCKIKPYLTDQEYKKLYPKGSARGKFYGTTKLHKISINGSVDKLTTTRPIISNIGTPTYQLPNIWLNFCHHLKIWKTLLQALRISLQK